MGPVAFLKAFWYHREESPREAFHGAFFLILNYFVLFQYLLHADSICILANRAAPITPLPAYFCEYT